MPPDDMLHNYLVRYPLRRPPVGSEIFIERNQHLTRTFHILGENIRARNLPYGQTELEHIRELRSYLITNEYLAKAFVLQNRQTIQKLQKTKLL